MYTAQQNNKRIAKNTLLLYFRMFFMMAISLYTSRMVLAALGVEDFGIYNVVGGVVTMFSFISGAMMLSSQRYISFSLGKGDFIKLNKVFFTSILLHLVIAIIILFLSETIGLWFLEHKMNIPKTRIGAANLVLQMSILSMIVMTICTPFKAEIIAHEKMGAFAYLSILEAIMKLVIVFLLYIGSPDKLILYAVLMFLLQTIISGFYGIYCKKNFKECKITKQKDWKLFKEMITFASWSLWDYISFVTYTQGLNMLLNIFFNPVVNAARGLSVQVSSAINNFSSNFQTAINPQITKSYATKDYAYMHSLIFRSSRISFILLFIVSLPVMLETETILSLWLTTVPDYTAIFIRISLLESCISVMANPLSISVLATGRIKKYETMIGIILLTILPISYIALKFGGNPTSVYIVSLILNILALAARLIIVSPLIQLKKWEYMKDVIIRVIIVSTVSSIIPLILKQHYIANKIITFFIIVVISVLCVTVCSYFFGLTIHERKVVMDKIMQRTRIIFNKS